MDKVQTVSPLTLKCAEAHIGFNAALFDEEHDGQDASAAFAATKSFRQAPIVVVGFDDAQRFTHDNRKFVGHFGVVWVCGGDELANQRVQGF